MGDAYATQLPDSALVDAAGWIRDLLTGSLALSIAIIAMAWLGFMALQGRMPWRDGARIVVGCFILFGSSAIAAALAGLAQASHSGVIIVPPSAPAPVVKVPSHPPVFDPYAGASVPNY